tara:strand:+ start:108 stop:677 length:570 start_codon:yes stop_codon:yes gene_type:complete
MFFKSPKKKGKEAGELLWKQISMGFLSMENLPLGEFNLPSDFFDDEYTIVYTVTFIETLRAFQYSGKNWSDIKRGDFLEAAFFEIDPTGGLLKKVTARDEKIMAEGKKPESEIQIQAADAAYATVGLIGGFVSSDNQVPVVRDTKAAAEIFHLQTPNQPFRISHAASITYRTITARTNERYGDKFNPNW